MTHGSLFSGIGGFDLAAEWMGWENKFHCEWNEFGQKVLSYYWPNAKSYADITKTDFSIHRGEINVLTGGFPCQPFSGAGKRKGKEDNRYLWPEMLRAIREIQPRWILGENVLGIVNWGRGLVFHEVQADMEAEGYEVFPYVLPACAKNAPHRRDRIWFVAYNDSLRQNRSNRKHEEYAGEGRKYALNDIKSSFLHSNDTEQQGKCFSKKRQRELDRSDSRDYGRTIWASGIPESPICRKDDGVSIKLDEARLFALGNAIVPQVAFEIFKAIEQYEKIILEGRIN